METIFTAVFVRAICLCLLFRLRCDQPHNNAYCIGQITFIHGIDKFPAILVGVLDGIIQGVTDNLFFFQNDGEARFSKERAFKIWSPRLAAAESGIRIFGFLSARISQMEFAPARDRTMSAAANRWRSGASTYSYCTYPGRPMRLSSRWPFPQICIT